MKNYLLSIVTILTFCCFNFINAQGCQDCADAGGFYCGDDQANWTSYSPDGCVPSNYLSDGWDDCVDGGDEVGVATDCGGGGIFEISTISEFASFDSIS